MRPASVAGESAASQHRVGDVFTWAAVTELNLNCYIGETILTTIYTHYGNLN